MKFNLKQNDTSPVLRMKLAADGAPLNLTGATVRFHMGMRARQLRVDAPATIVSALDGIVEYAWTPNDTKLPGDFLGEFEITYADGSIETVPNTDNIRITITPDLG